MDALVKQLQIGRSNKISGDVCAQVLSEITAVREVLKGSKPIRELIDLLLVRLLKYLAEKAAGSIIGILAGEALAVALADALSLARQPEIVNAASIVHLSAPLTSLLA